MDMAGGARGAIMSLSWGPVWGIWGPFLAILGELGTIWVHFGCIREIL